MLRPVGNLGREARKPGAKRALSSCHPVETLLGRGDPIPLRCGSPGGWPRGMGTSQGGDTRLPRTRRGAYFQWWRPTTLYPSLGSAMDLGLPAVAPSLRAPPDPPDGSAADPPREWSYEPLSDDLPVPDPAIA